MSLLEAWAEFERNVLPPEMSPQIRGKVQLAFYLGASEVIDRFAQANPPYVDFVIAINLECAQIAQAISQGAQP
jgi:hypothetical protein